MSPAFLVVGAQKAGTSSLFAYLAGHPAVGEPLSKEVRYFSQDYHRGHAWYLSNFPLVQEGFATTGEATPIYLDHPGALERIRADLPQVKVVTILRDPVDRLLSHYRHTVRYGREVLALPDALAAEDARLADDFDALRRDAMHPARDYQRYAYVHRSLYSSHVERIQSLFPERSLFLRLEDLTSVDQLRPLCDFLDLEFDSALPFDVHNANATGVTARTRDLPDAIRERLTKDGRRTADLLGWQPWTR